MAPVDPWYVPAAQSTHPVAAGDPWYVPAAQLKHPEAPVEPCYLPGAHAVHEAAFGVVEMYPAGQLGQATSSAVPLHAACR